MKEENKSVKNFPNLRFSGFEGEWEVLKLGDISERITKKNKENNQNVLTISAQYGLINQMKFFTKSVSSKDLTGYYILERGDFAYNKSYSNGYPMGAIKHLVNYDKGIVSTLYICFRFSNEIDKSFAQQFFESGKQNVEIEKIAQEGARNHGLLNIGVNDFFNIKLNLPVLNEQEKIASFLCLLDERITTQKKIIEQLETLMNTSREKIFSQKLRFKDEHGIDFPAWERKKIKEILTIGSGKDYKHLNDGTIPVYGTGGIITFVDSFLYDGETVCIGRKGTIDKPLYYNGKIWTVDTLFYTHSFNNSVPRFVFNIFQNINWKEYNEASGVPSLSKNTIENIEISITCLEEQTKIANFLSSIQEKIETEKQILEKLKLQKKFLLSNLFV